MKFIPLEIPDVILIQPKLFRDSRGFFYESYKRNVFSDNGIPDEFVQDNQSVSAKGVFRGFHYQLPPRAQAKLVSVLRGAAIDYILDIRKSSKTFGKLISYKLTAESREMLYVPRGFAHGFLSLEDNTLLTYKVTDYYSPQHERGILGQDTDLNIKWPVSPLLLSDKDQIYPRLKDAEVF